eukprot:CAMPEP_0172361084 /NCGR_PEP_ID=MMETSP1060-20121228/4978_1 /TAXON_ID=37318 /ORGANISM="Pseudo-nitzschia pungens, Strain cf. cingulata" /LENGTH=739 /DNA_ID=CAMNT_0013083245 /DNA_START=46 /DNA_END=2265 /DNA_ORIENTATION=+
MMFRIGILLCSVCSAGVVEAFLAPLARSPSLSMARDNNGVAFSAFRMSTDAASSAEEVSTDNAAKSYDCALLFDCDGVILETEELHRQAYNKVFNEFGVTKICGDTREAVEWSVSYYDILQNSIGGGKPKMRHYFTQALRFESNEHGDSTVLEVARDFLEDESESRPEASTKKKKGRKTRSERESAPITVTADELTTTLESLIDALQDRKTDLYKQTVEENAIARPGLLDLMDSALADPTIAVGVCSASTKAAAQKVLECTLGPDRVNALDVCILGDDVSEKKPSPMIYNAARDKLGIAKATNCVVVEDSSVGLAAAKAAGMRCIITYTESTSTEDFYGKGADAKVPDLVNNGNPVTLSAIFEPVKGATDDSDLPELLVGLKDDLLADTNDEEEAQDITTDDSPSEPVAEETAAPVVEEVDEAEEAPEPVAEEAPAPVVEEVEETPEPVAEETPEPVVEEVEEAPEPVAAEETPEPVVEETKESTEPLAEGVPELVFEVPEETPEPAAEETPEPMAAEETPEPAVEQAEEVEEAPEPVAEETPEPVTEEGEEAPEPVAEETPEPVTEEGEEAPEPVAEQTPEPVAEAVEEVPEPVAEETPEPVAEAVEEASDPVAEETPEPVVEEAPEPVAEETPEPVTEAVGEAPEPEPVVEEAPEPEPVAEEVEEAPEPVAEETPEPEPVVEEVEEAPEPVAEETPEPVVVEEAPTPPEPPTPTPQAVLRKKMKPRMIMDDMGNFSM